MVGCLGAVRSSSAGLARCSLGESRAGGDDEGDLGECTWWGDWGDDVCVDVLSVFRLMIFSKIIGSFWNVTLFLCLGLGSWKELGLSPVHGFRFCTCGGSWNEVPSWHSGFKWARFLLYFLPFGPSTMYERPCSKISLTVPVNHFSFAPCCFCGKKRTCLLTFRILSSRARWARSKCSFCVFCISRSHRQILGMLTGLWCRGMTAPCAGRLCRISAGDGRSFVIGVSRNRNNALAWAFEDPSVFL